MNIMSWIAMYMSIGGCQLMELMASRARAANSAGICADVMVEQISPRKDQNVTVLPVILTC